MENTTKTPEAVVTKPVAPVTEPVAVVKPAAAVKPKVILKNTKGKEVPIADYFYKGLLSSGFEGTCGNPVDREDLLDVFNKVFRPEDNLLFYKQADKEVYLVIVPIKYSVSIGDFNDSMEGDFQKHAISFLTEGSVNLDTLRQKLEKIKNFVKYTDR
jgi:hypothetical protein